jgi:hypothetical protein
MPALGQFPGSTAGLSSSVITRLTEQWKAEQRTFAARDLSEAGYVYLWADRIHVNIWLQEHKPCLLVMIGSPRRRPQGTHRARRRVPRVDRVMGRPAARLRPPPRGTITTPAMSRA